MPSQTIRIGLACNEGCIYCFADPELWADRPKGWGKDYSNLISDDWRTEIREIRRAGYDGLSISGGEPLLHPDVVKMVKYARLLGFGRVELQTNGALVTAENARRLARAGVCSALVSMPSHVEKVYNAITATREYHASALAGVRHLLDQRVRVTLAHVLCTANYQHVADYVDFVAEHYQGIQSVIFLYVQPEGRARLKPGLYPSLDALRPYWEEAMARCDRLGVPFRTEAQTGLPLCMMTGHEDHADMGLMLRPDEFWADDVSSFQYMQGHKRQGASCGECFFGKVCYGFWNEYLDAYGDETLRPVVETPRLRAAFPQIAAGATAPRLAPGAYVSATRMLKRGIKRRTASPPAAEATGSG